jgi:molybdopterin molybdotransferase
MVLMQEDAARDGDGLRLTGTPPSPPGKHLRLRGNDFAEGKELLASGTRLGPAQLGLALSAGHGWLAVRRAVRVAIIDSGDELSGDPGDCAPHQVPASNGAVLAALAAGEACEIVRIGPVADTMEDLAAALDAAGDVDLIVTSGGASVGDHDLIQPALLEWGATIDFWKVAIKPGKPLLVARRGTQLVLGLPGNPVSSMVTAYLFLLPLLRTLLGSAQPFPRPVRAELGLALPAGGDRREFLRANWDGQRVTPITNQDSGALAGLAAANALIDRPAGAPAMAADTTVPVYLLGNGGIA